MMFPFFARRILPLFTFATTVLCAQNTIRWQSPNGQLTATLELASDSRPHWSLQAGNKAILLPAPIGITLGGVDLGADSELVKVQPTSGEDVVAATGVAQAASVAWQGRTLELRHQPDGRIWTLETRLFDDGFAWRYRLEQTENQEVNGEVSSFKLPPQSQVWVAERPNDWKLKSYAGYWMQVPVEDLATFSPVGPVQGPPLVAELPGGGFALLTEAALADYSGMRLKAQQDGRLQADFAPFRADGPLVTPWRVALYAQDLNTLVNQRVIPALNPAPDPALFVDLSWIHYGKAAWRWWSSGTGTPAEEREFIDYAAKLGFAYSLVDDGWKDWEQPWAQIAELAAYGKDQGVHLLIWRDYKDLADPSNDYEALTYFIDKAAKAEVAGLKIDFFNAESKDRIDFEQRALKEAARRQLVVIFHGIQKPTGEARTFPNEVTREGIRGIELNKMAEGPLTAEHNTALPFTRLVVGAGDYTPIAFSKPGPTTWAHQVATLVAFTSPVQVIAEHPRMLLEDERTAPALPFIRDVPTVWDETRVLPGSKIGKLAALARRSGDQWWLAVLNNQPLEWPLDLSFLGDGAYEAHVLRSPQPNALSAESHAATPNWRPTFSLQQGDGLVIRFIPAR
ncbi:MAG: glycoside hydrolase family 97 catalytic domain-containing protein [Verrucomicrobiota bacterium JB022]|nr:glycoside hydrolase family 97 catalytic domain-containing protein [Verrucomicrobiota bacterium JB022]